MVELDIGSVAATEFIELGCVAGEIASVSFVSILAGSTAKRMFCAEVEEVRLLSTAVFDCCSLFYCITSGNVLVQPCRLPTDISTRKVNC